MLVHHSGREDLATFYEPWILLRHGNNMSDDILTTQRQAQVNGLAILEFQTKPLQLKFAMYLKQNRADHTSVVILRKMDNINP